MGGDNFGERKDPPILVMSVPASRARAIASSAAARSVRIQFVDIDELQSNGVTQKETSTGRRMRQSLSVDDDVPRGRSTSGTSLAFAAKSSSTMASTPFLR